MDVKELSELSKIVTPANVISTPECVTMAPTDSYMLQQVMSWATAHDIPLYVYRPAPAGGLAISLARLNHIAEIDADNLVAAVEPGVVLADLAAALASKHLRYIPGDGPFYQHKTLGELVYTGCANISGWKYGFAKHFLMGMDMVLPTGKLLHTGGKTVKNVTGYDLTRFLTGPLADLGVPVKFVLKLLPLPEARKNVVIRFKTVQQVFSFVTALRQAHVIPAYVIWVDQRIQTLCQAPAPTGDLVYLALDGFAEEVAEQWPVVERLAGQQQGQVLGDANKPAEPALPLAALAELYQAERGFALTDELKFPFARQQNFVAQFYALADKAQVPAGLFGQIGEGKINLYFNALTAAQHGLIKAALSLAKQAGGTVAGKYQRLYGDGGDGPLYELERRLRRTLDPRNVLNRQGEGVAANGRI